MDVKDVVRRQYRKRVNQMREAALAVPAVPREGWLRTVRKALGMSTVALGHRMGVSRVRIAQIEQGECNETVTLDTLRRAAEAMNCRLVYAVVPEKEIEQMIRDQAQRKAESLVMKTAETMALEDQAPNQEYLAAQIHDLADKLERKASRDFWEES